MRGGRAQGYGVVTADSGGIRPNDPDSAIISPKRQFDRFINVGG